MRHLKSFKEKNVENIKKSKLELLNIESGKITFIKLSHYLHLSELKNELYDILGNTVTIYTVGTHQYLDVRKISKILQAIDLTKPVIIITEKSTVLEHIIRLNIPVDIKKVRANLISDKEIIWDELAWVKGEFDETYSKELISGEDIHDICRKYHIRNYTINEDGSIDVNGDVNLSNKGLTFLPNFGKVTGNFNCENNQLESLKGAPKSVGGYFNCGYNQLKSLEGSPKVVGHDFECEFNELTTLEGCPESIGGDFYCQFNKIVTFEYLPLSMYGDFICISNPIFEIWKLFEDYSKIELFNYYDIIQDDVIILDRLNCFLEEIGKPTITKVKGYKCIK